jgi:ABC-type cobalt transport system substrate-binding protein
MNEPILSQIMALKNASIAEIKQKYSELFAGKKASSDNRTYLWQKIAYRIQELEYGGLPEEAQNKVKKLAQEYDPINNKALRPNVIKIQRLSRDQRLPIPGTVITKEYKGIAVEVKVLDKGFEYNGKTYKSLTAIAKEVTGCHWNGYLFFNM